MPRLHLCFGMLKYSLIFTDLQELSLVTVGSFRRERLKNFRYKKTGLIDMSMEHILFLGSLKNKPCCFHTSAFIHVVGREVVRM